MEWKDVKIVDYLKIKQLFEDNNEKEDKEILFKVFSIIENKDYNEVPFFYLKKKIDSYNFLKKPFKTGVLKKRYKLNGTTYKVFTDFNKLKTSQYLDFTNFSKDNTKIIEAAAVLLEQVKPFFSFNFKKKTFEEKVKDVETMNVEDFNTLLFFCQKKSVKLIKSFLRFFMKKMKKYQKKETSTQIN